MPSSCRASDAAVLCFVYSKQHCTACNDFVQLLQPVHVFVFVCLCVRACVCLCVFVLLCVSVRVYEFACGHECMYACMYTVCKYV